MNSDLKKKRLTQEYSTPFRFMSRSNADSLSRGLTFFLNLLSDVVTKEFAVTSPTDVIAPLIVAEAPEIDPDAVRESTAVTPAIDIPEEIVATAPVTNNPFVPVIKPLAVKASVVAVPPDTSRPAVLAIKPLDVKPATVVVPETAIPELNVAAAPSIANPFFPTIAAVDVSPLTVLIPPLITNPDEPSIKPLADKELTVVVPLFTNIPDSAVNKSEDVIPPLITLMPPAFIVSPAVSITNPPDSMVTPPELTFNPPDTISVNGCAVILNILDSESPPSPSTFSLT